MIMIQAAKPRDAEVLRECLLQNGDAPADIMNESSKRLLLALWLPLQRYEWHAGVTVQRAVDLACRIACTLLFVLIAGCAARAAVGTGDVDDFGVLVMAHGGPAAWNESVLGAVQQPLRDKYKLEVAFGMADAMAIQQGIARLEARGARKIAVIRLFVSGESWYGRTEQILGLTAGAPEPPAGDHAHAHHGGYHSMGFWRIPTAAAFALSTQGLAEAPEMGAVLGERARALSRTPELEDVLILAHGPGDDAENERWIAHLDARADAVRKSAPYRRVQVETLREDWPETREPAERRIRDFVKRASASGGKAIVIPYRVQGFGPYARVLDGLDYISDGQGLLPHPNVTMWIEQQIKALKAGPFREPAGAGGRSQARDHASSVAGVGVPKENSP